MSHPQSPSESRSAEDNRPNLPRHESQRLGYLMPLSRSPSPYLSPYPPVIQGSGNVANLTMIGHQRSPSPSQWVPASRSSGASLAASIARSGYSSSSQEVVFDYPGPQAFTFEAPPAGNQMNNIEQQKLITALREHRLNNILELCRIENVLMNSDGELLDLVEPLADAWSYYVGSHSLLNELRGLTRSFPFSSECLDEAKWLVDHDTQMGGGTQNYCLAVLMKIREESLVRKHAYIQTVAPEMWGGRSPSQSALNQLAERFIESWTDAVNRLLQYWEESRSRSR